MANGIYDLISRGIQDAKNYASIPATYAAGLYGNYINKNVGENMARSFRTDEMNERLSQQVSDQLSPGVNSGSLTYTDFGLPAGVSRYLGDGKFEPTRNFTAPTFKETMNVNSADLANAYTIGNLNFNRNPSGDINYTGNRYDFPQPTFMNNNPMDIPLDELNVNAPQFSFTNYLQGKNDINKFDERPSENTLQATQRRQASSPRALGAEDIKEEGIFSLGDILADLGRKGVEGFKDVAGRGIASQGLGTIGTMLTGNPLIGGIASLAGLFGGGDLFNSNSLSQRNFDMRSPEAQAYTSSLYGPGGLLEGYNQFSAFGKGAAGTIDKSIGRIMRTLQKKDSPFLQDRLGKLQAARDKITGTIRDESGTITGGSGQGTIDSGNTGGYGGTGGEGPSAVGSSGMLGGGV